MVSNILDSVTNTKTNLNGVTNVFSSIFSPTERVRVRNKLTEINYAGVLYAVTCPNNVFIEKFYENNQIDAVNSTGTFDSVNWQYTLLNTQILQSTIIAKDPTKAFKSVTIKVNGGVFTGDIFINYGNGFIAVINGALNTIVDSATFGQPLNAPLDFPLSGLAFPNELSYKIVNNSGVTINVTDLVVTFEYY